MIKRASSFDRLRRRVGEPGRASAVLGSAVGTASAAAGRAATALQGLTRSLGREDGGPRAEQDAHALCTLADASGVRVRVTDVFEEHDARGVAHRVFQVATQARRRGFIATHPWAEFAALDERLRALCAERGVVWPGRALGSGGAPRGASHARARAELQAVLHSAVDACARVLGPGALAACATQLAAFLALDYQPFLEEGWARARAEREGVPARLGAEAPAACGTSGGAAAAPAQPAASRPRPQPPLPPTSALGEALDGVVSALQEASLSYARQLETLSRRTREALLAADDGAARSWARQLVSLRALVDARAAAQAAAEMVADYERISLGGLGARALGDDEAGGREGGGAAAVRARPPPPALVLDSAADLLAAAAAFAGDPAAVPGVAAAAAAVRADSRYEAAVGLAEGAGSARLRDAVRRLRAPTDADVAACLGEWAAAPAGEVAEAAAAAHALAAAPVSAGAAAHADSSAVEAGAPPPEGSAQPALAGPTRPEGEGGAAGEAEPMPPVAARASGTSAALPAAEAARSGGAGLAEAVAAAARGDSAAGHIKPDEARAPVGPAARGPDAATDRGADAAVLPQSQGGGAEPRAPRPRLPPSRLQQLSAAERELHEAQRETAEGVYDEAEYAQWLALWEQMAHARSPEGLEERAAEEALSRRSSAVTLNGHGGDNGYGPSGSGEQSPPRPAAAAAAAGSPAACGWDSVTVGAERSGYSTEPAALPGAGEPGEAAPPPPV